MFFDWLVPAGVFALFFVFYNAGTVTPSEMIKTSGLTGITLLSLTLLAGPIGRFLPALDIVKVHRKAWGIASLLFVSAHLVLVTMHYYNFNVLELVNPSNPKFPGLILGLAAGCILLLVSVTSGSTFVQSLDPSIWKWIQMTSYAALFLAVLHFYFMEQVQGVLVIKRVWGQIAFGFAAFVLVVRLVVLLFPGKRKK